MEYIIMDLEWNQPTCYRETLKDPVFLTGEIIQIGAVKLNSEFRIVDKFSTLVRPQYYPNILPVVRELTGLKDWMFSGEPAFPEAASNFRKWCGSEFRFLIWGTNDIQILRSNLKLHGLDTDWLPESYNLQIPFAKQISHEQKQCSLESAVALVGERQGDAHDALGDAISTWRICRHLDMQLGLSDYVSSYLGSHAVESCIMEDNYIDTYDVLDDDYAVSFECPDCGEIVWCGDWYPQGYRKLVSTAACVDGTEFFVRLKISKCSNGFLRAKRSCYIMTDELRALYEKTKSDWEESQKHRIA